MIKPVIYKQIPASDPALIARAAALGVADLHEAMGAIEGRMCLMSPAMRPIAPDQRICGPAVTAYNFPGDNLMIHAVLGVAQAGQVLVLSNGGVSQGALWGELAATFAKKLGVAGVVVDGPARDVDALRALGSKTWSTCISPSHPEKRGPGTVNMPLVADGVLVEPGDIIAADADGVLVIPRAALARTVEAAEARAAKESDVKRRIASGEQLLDILGIRAVIDDAGIEQRDGTWADDPR